MHNLIKDIRANIKHVRQLKAQHMKQHGCTYDELRLKRLKGQLDSAGTPFDPVLHSDGAIDRDGKWVRRRTFTMTEPQPAQRGRIEGARS